MPATPELTVWHPADIFSRSPASYKEFSLIVLNQPLINQIAFYSQIWKNAIYHVGADGGANCVYDLNASNPEKKNFLKLDCVIGDLDSIRKEVRNYWSSQGSKITFDPDQDSTDFTKAFKYLKSIDVLPDYDLTTSEDTELSQLYSVRGKFRIKDIVCLGGLGGRVDQAMSVLHQLYVFQKELKNDGSDARIFLVSSEAITFVLTSGKHKIKARESFPGIGLAKHIGIIPLKEPSVITTEGLEWDVKDWPTEFGGQMSTSNHVKEDWVTVQTTKDVLFTIELGFSQS